MSSAARAPDPRRDGVRSGRLDESGSGAAMFKLVLTGSRRAELGALDDPRRRWRASRGAPGASRDGSRTSCSPNGRAECKQPSRAGSLARGPTTAASTAQAYCAAAFVGGRRRRRIRVRCRRLDVGRAGTVVVEPSAYVRVHVLRSRPIRATGHAHAILGLPVACSAVSRSPPESDSECDEPRDDHDHETTTER